MSYFFRAVLFEFNAVNPDLRRSFREGGQGPFILFAKPERWLRRHFHCNISSYLYRVSKFLLVACAFFLLFAPSCERSDARVATQLKGTSLTFISWNIANFGASTTDSEMVVIANVIREADVVAIEEVSTGPAGAQAVARLDAELDRKGFQWDYTISAATSGEGAERYAVLWKTSSTGKCGDGFLCPQLAASVDREPFMVRMKCGADTILLAVFHAVPKSKKPNLENQQLVVLDSLYEKDHLIITGDFNASPRTDGFKWTSRRNMKCTLPQTKTSLKQEPDAQGNYFANEYDNFWYEADELMLKDSGIIDFTKQFSSFTNAHKLSDHVPIRAVIGIMQ